MRIVHTADVHLGARMAGCGRAAPALRNARRAALERTLQAAADREADLVLIAGDLFDSERPDADVAESAFRTLAASAVPVAVIPGNHDPLAERTVWTRKPWSEPPERVRVFREPAPVERPWGLDVVLYPCPLESKDGRASPVSWIAEAREAKEGAASFHVGIAHGSLTIIPGIDEFPLAPEEVASLGLDYLALGHWHGRSPLAEAASRRFAYSGVPEPLKFGEPEGAALLVDLAPGEIGVREIETGAYAFATIEWVAAGGDDLGGVAAKVEAIGDPGRTILRVRLKGTAPLAAHEEAARFAERLEEAGFAHSEVDSSDLRPEPEDMELARLPRGPLRRAFEILLEHERSAPDEEKPVARRALVHAWELFGMRGE